MITPTKKKRLAKQLQLEFGDHLPSIDYFTTKLILQYGDESLLSLLKDQAITYNPKFLDFLFRVSLEIYDRHQRNN